MSIKRLLASVALIAMTALSACSGGSSSIPLDHNRSAASLVNNPSTVGDTSSCQSNNNCQNTGCNGTPGVDACSSNAPPPMVCDASCSSYDNVFAMRMPGPAIRPDTVETDCYYKGTTLVCPTAYIYPRATHPVSPSILDFLTITANAGVPSTIVSGSVAQNAVAAYYGGSALPSFSTTAGAVQYTASPALNEAFNGTTAPSFGNPSSITGNTLIRFSTSEAGANSGPFWTTADQIMGENGGTLTPAEIQNVFDLPYTPTYVSVGGQFAEGSTVFAGEVAGGAYGGAGGAAQLFSATAATGTEAAGIDTALEIIGGALLALDRQRHPMTHRRQR